MKVCHSEVHTFAPPACTLPAIGATPLCAQNLFYFLFHVGHKELLEVFNFWVSVKKYIVIVYRNKINYFQNIK
jgi:hypothetical protein